MTYSMDTANALTIVADLAARWGENEEEGFASRVTADTDDAACQKIAHDSQAEIEQVLTVRDLWRALETVRAIQEQQGCEHLGAITGGRCKTSGKLVDLIDVVVFG